MIDIMYDVPSIKGKKKVIVTKEVVEESQKPEIVIVGEKKTA